MKNSSNVIVFKTEIIRGDDFFCDFAHQGVSTIFNWYLWNRFQMPDLSGNPEMLILSRPGCVISRNRRFHELLMIKWP